MQAAKPTIVGAFVLGAIALAVGAILFFGGTRVFETTIKAVVFFQGSVAGLDVGGPVTFRGVRVGSVQRVELHLTPQGRATIPVTIELVPGQVVLEGGQMRKGEEGLEQLIAAGLRAQLNLQSFVTGQLRVDLDFRPGTPAHLVKADTGGLPQIPALPSEFERIRQSLAEVPVQELAQNAQHTLAAVERLAARLDQALPPLLEGTQHSVDAATKTLDTTTKAITQLQADLSHTLAELNGLVEDARGQVGARGAELSRVLQSADRAASQAQELLASVDSMTSPRSRLRGDLEATLRDLAASASSLRGFSREIERNPSLVLRGRSSR
jgi:paraquat-inducible protein B